MPPKTVPPHYECLGVDPSISNTDLARHYKKLSLQLHPDRAAYRNDDANEVHVQARFQRITEAYAVLSDPEKRNAYDTKHGVNFQSRLVRLQAIIGQHNTSVVLRYSTVATESVAPSAVNGEEAGSAVDSTSHVSASPQKHSMPLTANATANTSAENEEDDVDDDDDDYVPSSVVTSGARWNRADSSEQHGDHSESRTSDDAKGHSGDEWGSRVRSMFYLQPRAASAGAGLTENGVPVTQYRGVTLKRAKPTRASDQQDNNNDMDFQWGLVVVGNVVTGLQDNATNEAEASAIEGLSEIVFPAIVQQVNDTMVQSPKDISQILSIHAQEVNDVPAITTTTHESIVTEQLQLVLAFCTETFDLVGDTHLFSDDTLLHDVVPECCVAAEMPALMPGVRVLSVNGIVVNTAEELRQTLRDAAYASSDRNTTGDATTAPKRPRVTRSIALECCCLPLS